MTPGPPAGPPAASDRAPSFAVLGDLQVAAPGGARVTIGGGKQRALLGLLVLRRNRAVPASRLAGDLWGEQPPPGADATLRSHVAHLRRRLASVGAADVLTTGTGGYALAVPPDGLDADRFEHLVGLGQEALGLGHADRAAAHVRAALGLWRGPPFAGLEDVDAARAEATRLAEVRLVGLEVLGAAELAAGRHREIAPELAGWVAEHPFRERFSAQLMVALYRSGRQADALAAYNAVRARLADELGLDPGPELQALAGSILRQDPMLLGDAAPEARPAAGPATAAAAKRAPRALDPLLAAAAGTTLVGRTVEVERLEATWRTVAAGGHALVLLSGEAGIGKTRLTAGLADRVARAGHPVLVGRCVATGVAYHPLASALTASDDVRRILADAPESVVAGLAALLHGPGEPAADGPRPARSDDQPMPVPSAVLFVLRRLAAEGPLLLVVEDAERIDRASALLLRHLVDRLPAAVAVLVCYRDPPGGRHPPLRELVADPGHRDVTLRIELAPLAEPEIAELARGLLPDPDAATVRRLWQHTGGNPYFAAEVARSLAARDGAGPPSAPRAWDLPTGVLDVLRERLASVSGPAREVLIAAAVLGSAIDVDVLVRMIGTAAAEDEVARAVDEAAGAGLLVESGPSWAGSYAFPHDLMREAVLLQVPAATRRRLHLAAADALRSLPPHARGGSGPVAAHLRQAGPAADPGDAAAWSQRAAEEAAAISAWDEAIENADAAVDRFPQPAAGAAAAEAAVLAATLRLRSGRGYDRAVSLLESAVRGFVAAHDDAAAGTAHSRLGGALSLHHSVMDIPRALDHFRSAESLLGGRANAFHVSRGRSQAAMFGVRTDLLALAADRAAAVAAAAGRRDLAVVAAWGQAWAAFNLGRLAAAAELLERGWATAHELADPFLGWPPVNAASLMANGYLLDPAAARAWCRRGLGQPRFTALGHSHETVADQLGLALLAVGDLAAAREVVATLGEHAIAGRMLTFRDGAWERAADEWAAAAAHDEAAGDLHDAALNVRWLAGAREVLGDRDGAIAALRRALTIGRHGPQLPTELTASAELARLTAADDPAGAARHLARCDDILSGGEDWRGVLGSVHEARAAVAEARGEREPADTHQGAAVATYGDFGLRWHVAGALRSWAGRLDRRGEPARADEHRRESARIYAGMKAAGRWSASLGAANR